MSSLPNVTSGLPDGAATNPLEAAGNWNEPKTAYGKVKGKKIKGKKGKKSTLYPFNKVYESESGHVFEIDDTPGSERLHLFHRSGTFQEVHPNGDSVTKVVRDNYTSILRDNYVHIDGHCNVTIDKALKILVNSDKTQNTPNKATNFDIEVGENANINIIVNKGNCQLRLKNGDANVLIDRGDVNIRQEAGNYNHFVNGDYNLEVAGHMHVVVGEDYVNEIGGSRDVRIDGLFDNIFVTNGYSETTIPNGNIKYTIGQNKEEFIGNEYHQKVITAKITEVDGVEEKRVLNSFTVQAGNVGFIGTNGVGLGTNSGGFDISADGNFVLVSNKQISLTTPKFTLTSLESIDILSQSVLRMSGNTSMDIYSGGVMNLTSNANTNLLSSSGIFQTAPQIHLNGPTAQTATPANSGLTGTGLSRIEPPIPPAQPFIYTPGSLGKWRKTINGVTPLNLVRTSVETLKAQLAALDQAANTANGLKEQSDGLISSLTNITSSVTDATPAALTNLTNQTAQVANNLNGVVENVSSTVETTTSTIQSVTDTVSSVSAGITEPLKAVIGDDGPLSGIKGAIGAMTGFIGDIISTVADIACTIVDAIGSIIDAVFKTISDAIKSVLDAVKSVVDAIGAIISAITKIIADAIKQITDLIASIIDAAGKFIDGIIDAIASIFDGIEGGRPSNCGLSLGVSVGGTSFGIATAPGA